MRSVRLPPTLAAALAVALAGAACTPGSAAEERAATPVVRPIQAAEASTSTTTTVPPTTTTTVAPTTTTTAAPPTTAPPAPAVAPAPPAPPPPAPARSDDEGRALQLVNDERAKAGLAPLSLSTGARSVAREWSRHMAGSGLGHNPDLSGDLARAGVTGWRAIGENVGRAGSVDEVHALFMGSGGHRTNILKAAYSHVGIGVVRSGGQVWVTMDFVGY